MNSGVDTNIEEVFERFCSLTQSEMKKVVKRAIGKGAAELKKQTVANLKTAVQPSGSSKYSDELTDAVRVMKVRGDYGEELEGGVHIMGVRKSGSGTFRARFFEKGTKDRYAKNWRGRPLQKPRCLGRITARGFFRAANASVLPQLERLYMEEIDKTINKINATKI